MAGSACFTLRFVSPSRFAVSTYASPSGSELLSRTRSAGKNSSRDTRTISPTHTSRHALGSHVSWTSTGTRRAFISISDVYLRQSSAISFAAATSKTIPKGTNVVQRFVGDTPGICWIHPINRKNTFAYLENCSSKNTGTNVTRLYLFVMTWLLLKSSFTFALASFKTIRRLSPPMGMPRNARICWRKRCRMDVSCHLASAKRRRISFDAFDVGAAGSDKDGVPGRRALVEEDESPRPPLPPRCVEEDAADEDAPWPGRILDRL